MDTHNLSELLKQFPGVGRRQAERFAYYLIKRGPNFAAQILHELEKLHSTTKICTESFALFQSTDPTITTSPIVRDITRDNSQLMIVEKDLDIHPLEMAGYRGQYFVLGGLIPLIPKKVATARVDQLMDKIRRDTASGNLREIIFGLSWNPESEHTREQLTQNIESIIDSEQVTISSLGRGLSTGSELEYTDSKTLEYALKKRL